MFFLLLIIIYPIKAQINDSESEESYLINDIEISGLKRTKKHVVEKPLNKFIGQDASKIDLNDVRTSIFETGILEPLSVEIEDDPQNKGKILKIEIHEKWSIFPLPVFFINSSGIVGGGLGFIDLNAMGINDKFVVGGLIDTHGWLAGTGYIHTPDINNLLGWNAALFYSKQERTDSDEKDKVIRKFGLSRFLVTAGINYEITEPTLVYLNLTFTDAKLHGIDHPFAVPEDGGSIISLSPGFRILKNNWDGYFLSQKSIEIGYRYSFGIDSSSFQRIDFKTNFEKSLVPGFRMFFRGGIIYAPETPPVFESGPRSVNISILPQSYSAQNFFGTSAGLEKYFFKRSWGTLSILSSYQVVYSDGPILGERIDHGVLGAIQFYLSKIAIPAVGLGVSYNASAGYLLGAFNVGMSF
ncbi:MAG: hypothetical protein FWE72_06305 [Spirochaetaceae bacterium]|nr:hypothetical protein [Spirochaetaceae bacterium]